MERTRKIFVDVGISVLTLIPPPLGHRVLEGSNNNSIIRVMIALISVIGGMVKARAADQRIGNGVSCLGLGHPNEGLYAYTFLTFISYSLSLL